ncbi:MAG: DUF3987 domain-containing protein [Acidovorax sp.]|uniref:YfjI family protein n=1 Tax=Acidovorax sp. TaxID=1872122 RepID=UPI0025BF0EC8|nr:YfjI family protein [Acidovorax sp.]MCE1194308.1 DUF3987 domain-containing protein [Acidovorax sp.]
MNVFTQPIPDLPKELDQLVHEIQTSVQAPRELIVTVLLGAIALSVQHYCRVELKPKLSRPVGLLLLAECESGERKSAVLKLLFKPFTEIQRRWSEEASAELATYEVEHALWREKVDALRDALRRAARKGASTDEIEKKLREILKVRPKRSSARRLIYADVTPEALLEGLHEFGNSAALVYDEFSQFCDGPMARQLGILNTLWSGEDVPVNRKTSPSFVVNPAGFTCLFLPQPSVLGRFLDKRGDDAHGNGFLARVLPCSPLSTQGHRFENGVQAADGNLQWFYDRCNKQLEKTDPRLLKFSPQAQANWISIANFYESSVQPGGPFHESKEFASKAAENIARIAAVLHAFLYDNSEEISPETLQYANDLFFYYGNQHLRSFARANPLSEDQRNAMDLCAWIYSILSGKRWNYVTKAYILQYGPNRLRNKAKLDLLLEYLAASFQITIWKQGKRTLICQNTPVQMLPAQWQ